MRCFLLAVSQASTLDRYTNNFSLFFLLEELTPSAYPVRLQAQTHAFFEVDHDERKVEHEVRLVVASQDKDEFFSDALTIEPASERHRVRMNGLVIPNPGAYRVLMEWRRKGHDAWIRGELEWPLKANSPLQ